MPAMNSRPTISQRTLLNMGFLPLAGAVAAHTRRAYEGIVIATPVLSRGKQSRADRAEAWIASSASPPRNDGSLRYQRSKRWTFIDWLRSRATWKAWSASRIGKRWVIKGFK